MPAMRATKIDQVNAACNDMALQNAHRDVAHAQKRQWAATNDARLQPEADLRGLTVEELAALILSKPDEPAARELRRQTKLAAIAASKTPAELDAIG